MSLSWQLQCDLELELYIPWVKISLAASTGSSAVAENDVYLEGRVFWVLMSICSSFHMLRIHVSRCLDALRKSNYYARWVQARTEM